MPQYCFNLRNGEHLTRDTAAAELRDIGEARESALAFARDALAAKVLHGEVIENDVFEICNAGGQVLAEVPFRDALRLHEG